MTYYDRYGEPLQLGDAVAALRGDDEIGYTAMLYVIAIPTGHHTPMLCSRHPFGNVYRYIPSDAARLRLTRLGPWNKVGIHKFERWREEVSKLPNVDSEILMKLRFKILKRYGR